MNFKDKITVITGAGRGIGKETALAFAREGASLALLARHEETVAATARECEKLGADTLAIASDISSEPEAVKFVDAVYEKFGHADIIVNNAGITRDNLLVRMDCAQWDEVMAVNLRSVFLCTRLFSRKMLRQKSGRIINITSIAGEAGNMGQSNYSASKAGVIGFTKAAARELARYGITVNAVSPGIIETDMIATIEQPVLEEIVRSIPLGRVGRAADVAATVMFLASGSAGYITGHTIRVDGGLYI